MTNPFAPQSNPLGLANPLFKLEYPHSIGVYTSYADAQKAVDSLADRGFPVANIAIVGTDLKLIERVTGRKTWGTVLMQGVTNGLSTAFMVALIIFFLDPTRLLLSIFSTALLVGVLLGVTMASIGYALSRGQRDFTSVSQTIPSKFEILCEHKVAADARALLAQTPDARAAAFDPARAPQAPYAPQQPQAQPSPQSWPYGQPGVPQPYPQQPQPPYGQPQPQPQPPYGVQAGPQLPAGPQAPASGPAAAPVPAQPPLAGPDYGPPAQG